MRSRLSTRFVISIRCQFHFNYFPSFQENGRKLLNQNPTEYLTSEEDVGKRTQDKADLIKDFESFRAGVASSDEQETWREYWNIFEEADLICFYHLSRDVYSNSISISFKILVDSQMRVTIFRNEIQADSKELDWVTKDSTLKYWSQFSRLIDYYQTAPDILRTSKPGFHIERALAILEDISPWEDINGAVSSAKDQLTAALIQLDRNVTIKKEVEDVEEIKVEVSPFVTDVKSESCNDSMDEMEVDVFVKEEPESETASSPETSSTWKVSNPIEEKQTISKLLEKFAKPPSRKKPKKIKEIIKGSFQCEHCERKFDTSRQLTSHFHNSHVRT